MVRFSRIALSRLFRSIDYEMNHAIEIPRWDSMVRWKNSLTLLNKWIFVIKIPICSVLLAFDRSLKNVLFVLRNHIYVCIYMFSYRSVPPRPVLSVQIFRMRSVCRAEIADFQSHREWYYRFGRVIQKNVVTYEYGFPLFPYF